MDTRSGPLAGSDNILTEVMFQLINPKAEGPSGYFMKPDRRMSEQTSGLSSRAEEMVYYPHLISDQSVPSTTPNS